MATDASGYDHLNEDTPIVLELGGVRVSLVGKDHMAKLVSAVLRSNYGMNRFLAELLSQLPSREHLSPEELKLLEDIRAYFSARG